MSDDTYSPDVEIDEAGKLVFARDVEDGEFVTIPIHLLHGDRAGKQEILSGLDIFEIRGPDDSAGGQYKVIARAVDASADKPKS